MTVEVPESAMRAIGENAEAKVRLWAAIKGYELHELTASAAADLAGLAKVEFLQELGRFGFAVFDQSWEELEREVQAARRAGGR